jgi:hypothetical protein
MSPHPAARRSRARAIGIALSVGWFVSVSAFLTHQRSIEIGRQARERTEGRGSSALDVYTRALPLMYTLAYLVINVVPSGRMVEARAAAARMLDLRPQMAVSDALEFCHKRDRDWFERMKNAFRESGLPE